MIKKLLVILPCVMPTTEIALRTIRYVVSENNLKVVTQNKLQLKDVFSGKYQILFMRQHEPSLNPLLDLLIKHKISYLYYIDDNFWEISGNTPIARCYQNKAVKNTVTTFVKNAFAVITPSDYLKNYIKRFTSNVIYIDAAFDFGMLSNVQQDTKTDSIKVLYSGTPYRENDFHGVVSALERIVNEYKGKVQIHFNGFSPKTLKNTPNIFIDERFYPYEEHIRTQFKMNYDIGIAPLSDTIFNRSKSYLKFREYSACGMVGIYTNIPPYSDCVRDKENGLLVQNTKEAWYIALKTLIDNKEMRQKLLENALSEVLVKYTHEAIAPAWSNIFSQLPTSYPIKFIPGYLLFAVKIKQYYLYVEYKLNRALDYFRYDGIRTVMKKTLQHLFSFN